MGGHLFLPFIETMARDTEFTGNLGGWALPGIQQLNGLSCELRGEPSSLGHVPPPAGAYRAPI